MENRRPAVSQERSQAVDALRGLALFGVVLINTETFFRLPLFTYYSTYDVGSRDVDRAVFLAYSWLFEFKSFAVYCVLFGAGLASTYHRVRQAGGRPTAIILRRLAALTILGALNVLVASNCDILLAYGIAGTVVIPLLLVRPAASLWAAAGCAVFSLTPLPWPAAFPSAQALPEYTRRALEAYGSHTGLRYCSTGCRKLWRSWCSSDSNALTVFLG